jgi:hypothetical protein
MLHGNTFDAAVANLGLQQRAAAQLSVLLALMKPNTIVHAGDADEAD